ncbi:MAG: Hsp70 family protein, partial [Bacteroidota bacterium]
MMINFGIDLGTTNSAIAKYDKGQVILYRNPIGQKNTLPSVVGFRKGRILIGEKAREYVLKAPGEVVGSFKRKMGTTETWQLTSVDEPLRPVDLSAFVLRELKSFVHSGEKVEAAVVTIPASFDTIQSNATKEAGQAAGLEQVVLLQEPIAASLAYANHDEVEDFREGQWLVYDLGGGTFDVALIKIAEGEMQVIDHEGDNFLGGTDLDRAIVESLIIPQIEQAGTFENLKQEMTSASGKHNKLFNILMLKAEEAKIELSATQETEIECAIEDDEGTRHDLEISILRKEFEALVEPMLARTIEMMQQIITRNELSSEDLSFVLMVGGSTYIPYVRQQLGERLGISINTNVDPTTAVAVGAAWYAGTQPRKRKKIAASEPNTNGPDLDVKMAWQKASQETKEYFAAVFKGKTDGLFYRIIREDGGYDSGLLPLQPKIELELPLVKDAFNQFSLKIFDHLQNPLSLNLAPIGIAQGKYSVVGQPLPNDICLEIDDVENNTTVLDLIFEKNAVLPLRKTIVKQVTRTISKGSEERLTISVVEGPGSVMPSANQAIGFISVSGTDLERDLIAGSDIEITLEMSESRDLRIEAYLMMTDQEFSDVFSPSERRVNVLRLSEELYALAEKIRKEIDEAERNSNFEAAQTLVDLEFEILELADKAKQM